MKAKTLLSYDAPEIKVILFGSFDVIATSEVSGDDMDDDGWTSV